MQHLDLAYALMGKRALQPTILGPEALTVNQPGQEGSDNAGQDNREGHEERLPPMVITDEFDLNRFGELSGEVTEGGQRGQGRRLSRVGDAACDILP